MTANLNRLGRYLAPLVLVGWFAGAVAIWLLGRRWQWSPGELVLAGSLWLIVLAAVAREPVRNLFGPVFWYEITRVGRRFSTFLLRFLYVLVVCGVLTLMYTGWRNNLGQEYSTLLFSSVCVLIECGVFVLMYMAWQESLARRFNTSLFSTLCVLVGFGVLTLIYLARSEGQERYSQSSQSVPPGVLADFATEFFNIFSIIQYGMVLLVTPAYVAGTITDEKERKTIDYLFTTDLANREIVFGKLAARLATVILYVLAGLPVIAFLQLFGGIDPDLALASTAASLVTAVGLSAVAIALSAAMKRSREAILASYGLLALYLVGTIVLSAVMMVWSRGGWTTINLFGWTFNLIDVTDWLAAGNAVLAVPMATRGGTTFDPAVIVSLLGRYVVFWSMVSVLAIGWAVTRLRRVALQQSHGPVVSKKAVVRQARKRPAMGNAPWVWKEVFTTDRRGGCFGVLFRAVVIGAVAIVPILMIYFIFLDTYRSYRSFSSKWEDFVDGVNAWVRVSTGVITFLLCLAAALRGASAVAGEKDRDTWVSLCVSPVTVVELLFAKWLGAMLGQRFLLWVLGVIWVIGILTGAVYWFMVPVTLLFLSVFLSGFALAGIWCSISARTALVANVRAFFLAVFMAGGFWLVILFCCIFPMALGRSGPGREFSNVIIMPVAATPPVMTGFLPMGSFKDRRSLGPGPFHPENVDAGPCAPPIGLGVWIAINFGLLTIVRLKLTHEMNRGDVFAEAPDQMLRRIPVAKPITPTTSPDDYSPEDPRMQD